MERVIVDTSVLIAGDIPTEPEVSISTVSIAELHFGLHAAVDGETRGLRIARLGAIEARFPDPLPIDNRVAREWGRLQAAVADRGGNPRTRNSDLAIAATANIHGAVLMTHDVKHLRIIDDLVDVRRP